MPSQLWDALGISSYAFVIQQATYDPASPRVMHDDAVVSMTLTRGSGAVVGTTNNTATIVFAGAEYGLSFDAATTDINLSNAATAAITAKAEGFTGASITADLYHRWHGRIAGQKVTDTGDRREPQWVTTQTCVDVLPLINDIGAPAHVTKTNNTVSALVESMIATSGIGIPYPFEANGEAQKVLFKTGDPTTYSADPSKVQSHFVADLGGLLRVDRAGVPQLLNYPYRQALPQAAQTFAPYPITRDAPFTPVSWEQRITVPHGVHWDQSDGYGWDVVVGSNNPAVGKWPTEILDMKDIQLVGGQTGITSPLEGPMQARVWRSARDGYSLDTLQFDILAMLNHPSLAMRRLAVTLLTMEPGDPIAISADWPYQLPYGELMTATRIQDTITPKSWTVALDLVKVGWTTGKPSPPYDGGTWDHGNPRGWTWDQTPERWDER